MATKFFALACIRNNSGESRGGSDLSPRPHYPSMPTYPKGVVPQETTVAEVSEAKAVFSVIGMTCSACAGSVEKAVKRLPGIREAVVDVLNNRAQVMFFPSFVNVSPSLYSFFPMRIFDIVLLDDVTLKNIYIYIFWCVCVFFFSCGSIFGWWFSLINCCQTCDF